MKTKMSKKERYQYCPTCNNNPTHVIHKINRVPFYMPLSIKDKVERGECLVCSDTTSSYSLKDPPEEQMKLPPLSTCAVKTECSGSGDDDKLKKKISPPKFKSDSDALNWFRMQQQEKQQQQQQQQLEKSCTQSKSKSIDGMVQADQIPIVSSSVHEAAKQRQESGHPMKESTTKVTTAAEEKESSTNGVGRGRTSQLRVKVTTNAVVNKKRSVKEKQPSPPLPSSAKKARCIIMATFDEIKDLCLNKADHSESELISILKGTEINTRVLLETDEDGRTLLHYAAKRRSPEFCRVIHDKNTTLVKIQNRIGWLPLQDACYEGNVNAAKYLYSVYPESSNIPGNRGSYPLHILARCHSGSNENVQELLLFLLKHDKGSVSTPNDVGELPLHYACETKELELVFVKLLFDAHPDGIFVEDIEGHTPIDIARFFHRTDALYFLRTQLGFHRQAQEDQERDNNEQLPIHRVLQTQNENVSLGTIKLMVGAHRASVTVADIHGCIPLHYACRLGDLNVVKYLVDNDKNSLATLDSGGNLPLHHACRAGKPDIVSYILNMTDHGVTVRNNGGKLGKLPIQILLFDAVCDRDLQYIDAVDSLFRANPVDSLAIISPGLFANTK